MSTRVSFASRLIGVFLSYGVVMSGMWVAPLGAQVLSADSRPQRIGGAGRATSPNLDSSTFDLSKGDPAWADPVYTEAAWSHHDANFPAPPVAADQPTAEKGAVSVQELRRPLKGKALQQVRKAADLLKAKETEQAMELLNKLAADPETRPYALSLLGAEHLKGVTRDPQLLITARAELESATEELPQDPANRSNLAIALFLCGEFSAAQKEAQRALQLDPTRPKIRYVLGQILLQRGQVEQAKFHLKIAAVEMEAARRVLETLPQTETPQH